jgi:hypothetical protein
VSAAARLWRLGLAAALVLGAANGGLAAGAPAKQRQAASGSPYGPGDVYAKIPPKDEYGRDQLAMFRAWNPDPLGNDAANLAAVDPLLARTIRRARADNPGLRFVIGSGRRSAALQRLAVSWGWSMTRGSLHRTGSAVDLWPLDEKGRVDFDPAALNRVGAAMKRAAAELGVPIRWGDTFHGFKDMDRSHFQIARRPAGR